jgi:hypothetical protein
MKYVLAKIRDKHKNKFSRPELKAQMIGEIVDCDDFECMIELPNKQLILVPRSHVNEICENRTTSYSLRLWLAIMTGVRLLFAVAS